MLEQKFEELSHLGWGEQENGLHIGFLQMQELEFCDPVECPGYFQGHRGSAVVVKKYQVSTPRNKE